MTSAVACCLILLALSPFTAPFSTCDLTVLASASGGYPSSPGPSTIRTHGQFDRGASNLALLSRAVTRWRPDQVPSSTFSDLQLRTVGGSRIHALVVCSDVGRQPAPAILRV